MKHKKYCPVCGGLVAVWQGDPDKYGDKAVWNWNAFIRLKYCSDECRDIMSGNQRRLSNKRRRKEKRAFRETAIDAINALRAEAKASQERVRLLERQNRAALETIRRLEARP